MMKLKFRIILAVFLILGLIYVVNKIRKRELDLKYAITWILLSIVILIIVAVPGLLNWMTMALGIYDAMNMVFFLGFIFCILIIFSLTIALSRQAERIRELTQQVALSEYDTLHEKEDAVTKDAGKDKKQE